MEKIKRFFITNKAEFLSIFSLLIIFSLLVIFFSKHLGSIIVDCGHEAYFPQEVLMGKVLFKDLFNAFGPLSYQINAFLYGIFGISLDTLRLAGIISAFLILSTLYALSRFFTSKEISWVITFFIMVSCAFNPWIFNYIFPYAFAITYAFSAFLFSALFLILYFKTSKRFFMPLSWFFIGASMASKYEYLPYFALLIALTAFSVKNKGLDWKHLFYCVISFLLVPACSYSILFLQGLTIHELITNIQMIKAFSLSPSLNRFYSNFVGLYPNKENFISDWVFFKSFFPNFIFALTSIYLFFKSFAEKVKDYKKITLSLICAGFFLTFIFSYFLEHSSFDFCWLPLFTILIFLTTLIDSMKNKIFSKTVFFSCL